MVSEILAIPRSRIYFWKNRYDNDGYEGLKDRKRRGRPRRVDYEDLRQVLSKPPIEFGYNQMNWTIPMIQRYLNEYKSVIISHSYVYQLLKRLHIDLKCHSINCHIGKKSIRTSRGKLVTPLHLEIMQEAQLVLDAPIDKIITQSGIKPVLSIVRQDNEKTILQGKTEHGLLTLQYEHFS